MAQPEFHRSRRYAACSSRMLALRPVPSWTRSSSGLAARAKRRTVLRDKPGGKIVAVAADRALNGLAEVVP